VLPLPPSVTRYLRAPANGLWRWAEDGSVVTWHDDTTVAFRQELVPILESLAPGRLPPLGAILILLAACRGKIPTLEQLLPPDPERPQLRAQILDDLQQLQKLASLPAELKTGLIARRFLAETVFEFAATARQTPADRILATLARPYGSHDPREPQDDLEEDGPAVAQRQVHLVALGLRPHTAESLALRLRTSLEALPDPAALDLFPADRARSLIEQLSKDRDYAGLARAARELLAAIRLPRQLGQPVPPPFGGIADIAHHGTLDRLLLSELAHDDLTLSVRVALNEALYLRQEPPASPCSTTLVLLLDSGIRLWGMPRLFAAAVALAIVAHQSRQTQVRAWRAKDSRIVPIDLLSKRGLADHLSVLETLPHPGAALADWQATVTDLPDAQPILITHADVLQDPEFRACLAATGIDQGFIARVDTSGRFELHMLPLASRPPICSAVLDAKSIFHSPIRIPFVPESGSGSDLPIAFQVSPFPLLLPIHGRVLDWCRAPDQSVVALIEDGCLVRYVNPTRGAGLLATNILRNAPEETSSVVPPVTLQGRSRTVAWMEADAQTVYLVTTGPRYCPAVLTQVPLDGSPSKHLELDHGPLVLGAHRQNDVLLIFRSHEIRAYSLENGHFLNRIVNPHAWNHGRYLIGDRKLHFASWDGTRIRIETLGPILIGSESNIHTAFDRTGHEGPWYVLENGRIIPSSDTPSEERSLGPDCAPEHMAFLRVSHDGQQITYQYWEDDEFHVLDLETGSQRTESRPDRPHDPIQPPHSPPRKILMTGLLEIGRHPRGIAILDSNRTWKCIVLGADHELTVEPIPSEDPRQPEAIRSFAQITPRPDLGCDFSVAEWSSGSRAFLDSRGFLHLKSHLPGHPEVTLALDEEDRVAGWTSEGTFSGPPFFQPETTDLDPKRVHADCLQFLDNL